MPIFIFLLAAATAVPAFSESSLVKAFCAELVFRDHSRLAVFETRDAWEDFSERLERREVRAEVPAGELRTCVADYRDEMERGEFILDGKQMLERLASQPRGPVRETDRDPALASVTLPGFGEVPLGATRRVDSIEAGRIAQRSERYESLWKSFLEDLRKTMTARRPPHKMGPEN